MATDPTTRAIEALTEGEPSYDELLDIYNNLREASGATTYERISQRALAQVVGEFIDYLDFVATELEKSVGLTRAQERERVLGSFHRSPATDTPEAVVAVIEQWESVERYSYEEIQAIARQPDVESKRLRHHAAEFDQ
jgi:hypothetical protein